MTAPPTQPNALSAVAALAALRAGTLTANALTEACLARIAAREPAVQAWIHLDPEAARAQAAAADAALTQGRPPGPLHGLPVGLKDIIDTHDMPTENGTVLHAGRRPKADAALVARLRRAGAVLPGKTVTTELATYHPGRTRNPHDATRTPGGSSSGSAAAVADCMVPLAVGTQTNGSVIRPAGYCGVIGYKPTHGLIPRTGVLAQSRPLDQVGVFARSVADAALLAEVLIGFDPGDPDSQPAPAPRLVAAAQAAPPTPPRLAFVRSPVWDKADPATQAAFEALAQRLAPHVEAVTLPPPFGQVVGAQQTVMEADLAKSFATEYAEGKDRLSDTLRGQIERGQEVTAVAYNTAVALIVAANAALRPTFAAYDALLAPATTGVAPVGEATGSPIFCTLWTFCGTPAITLPLLTGEAGMPLGVQLVAARRDDARLLRTAAWLSGACVTAAAA